MGTSRLVAVNSCNPHAFYHMMTDYLPVLRDFDLAMHGLQFVMPNVQVGAVFPDGKSLVLCQRTEDAKDGIALHSEEDARRYGKLMRTWHRAVDEILAPGTYLPSLSPIDMAEALEATPLGRELLRLTESSPLEILEDAFDNERVRAVLLYLSCMWGLDPVESGLGFMVPLMLDRAVHKAQCYGGSHKLAGALSRVVHEAGGIVLDNTEVVRIATRAGAVEGVECADGRFLEAPVVCSSLAPPLTFGRLLAPEAVPAELSEAAEHWEWDKWSLATLAIVTLEPPRYACEDPWVDDALMVLIGIDDVQSVLEHFGRAEGGELGAEPIGHATVETRYDPTLARMPGHHVSFFQTQAPYDVTGGWDHAGPVLSEQLLTRWQRAAPNLGRLGREGVLRRSFETPVDIERRLASMVRGSIKHGDYTPLQMGAFRPSASCQAGRSPIEGLYLCGASSYPGGLVIGGPGYIAARSIAEDLDIEPWWSPPRFVQRFCQRYLAREEKAGGGES